ncbi:condensation domain-containing protein [Actinacidiphila bryophytorum]|uniref:Amino acid adenylation domain-containing protein n=2 Tax=Actinacidiphila bryophytorum TaxID=1436133 RepID=A0A9W4MEM6_9ACTN|nr:condensation domain-containing protein [Actinacidiphila bryophytorum]MBM9439360.1 AMP-binding protein [Actinacidiphila bryophytorum]CAG7638449.1 Amino acid adenylation domain-containing protein [Actinacidiphila bryophytorum]
MSERDRGPLTAAQRRLWFLSRLDPDDPAYNISACVLLRGDLDTARLVRAFDSVVAVHECLRTRFVEEDGEPLQEVLAPRALPVHHADVADLAEARRAVEELVARPFDLAQGHLIRIGLLRLSATEHVLCAVTHHSVGDGWSLNLLYRQAADAYRGIAPTPPGMRYLDHARAHQGDDEASTAYWRAVLDRPPVLELPLDRPRPARRTSAGICAERSFDDETWEMVQRVARELRCTPFMVLMTAYQLTLSQISGQQDLCVATAVAGRDDVAAESVFGYFVRMLVLRADLSGDITVGDLVRRTRTACLGAFAHQEVPFEQLVADLGLARDPSHNPFFQATMTLHSTMDVSATGFDGADGFEGVTAEGFGDGSRRTLTDVAMDVFVTPTAINARAGQARMDILLTAAADLFDAATVEAAADRFTAVLRVVLADLDAPVRQLPLVDEAAAAELLRMGTGPAVPGGPPLTDAVERAVAAAPEAVALHSGTEQVSYRQLWERSRELADALQAAGVRPGHLVGVAMPRGPEQIAALLAAWRSGAGYVPLDTALPAPRRDLLVEQSGVAAVVTPDGITPGAHTPVQAPGAAYVLFTSGSTGTPKPVLVGQAALRDRVAWMAQAYGTGPADLVVQFAALGFDTHAEEIWPTLASGGTLVLLPGGTRSLPEVLAAEPAITVLDLPTAYWQALLDLDPVWPAALRLVILGGEQVDAAAVTRWRALHGDRIRLTNTYGPTEAGVIATAVDLTDGGQDGRRPPIGRPIGGVRAYLLDPAGRLVPRGSAGELCLAGAGLADGYPGRPDLTAERFPPDPYGEGRMYRTGDRARWRRDAPLLEFLGRLDRQLKVRGVRIEPGEVEAALTTHPSVGQAVVTAADQTLVAYVTGTATADAVRAHAAEVLPALLVPGVVMVLPALPLTANGKVDLAALPAPAAGDDVRAAFQAPRTDAEHLVAAIFGELLGLDQVGARDDFFVLGGHSLLAVRAIGRLRAAVGLDLPVRAMFEQPTVEGFARAVEDALAAEIENLTDDEAAAELAVRTGGVAADSFATTNEPVAEPVTRAVAR